ncbi:MAG: NAD(P)-dependent oxidoreductase [Bacteroidota bacterium]|nr:NAD(P)-dependent oxidoreductase [Bacteroidota bacterium]MDP4195508.1 NAD(P)-dependent oxidoreductase [Bacteroidota bacterium]
MRILVTGGAGYVGSVLVPLLLSRGYQIRVYDNLMYGGESLLPLFTNSNFEFVKGDVRDMNSIKIAAKGCDAIIHLAAIVGYPACRKNPALAQSINYDGTRSVLQVSDGRTILFASTGSNYGSVADSVCTEDTPLNPLSLYGTSKTEAERLLLDAGNVIAYRFATAFGVSSRLRLDLMINDFTYKAKTQQYLVIYEKNVMRTFIHVYDMARSFLFGIENMGKMRGEVYNVGSEKMNYSKQQICDIIKQKTECYVHYADIGEDVDKRDYVVSYKKINELGYDTSITVEEGVDELLKALSVIESREKYSNA